MELTPEQTQLLGKLLSAGVPLPIAFAVVLDPNPMQSITQGVQTFNMGANAVLDTIAQPKKAKKRASAYSRKYKSAFKKVAPKYKLKNGRWKKGGFKRAVKEAHRVAGGKRK